MDAENQFQFSQATHLKKKYFNTLFAIVLVCLPYKSTQAQTSLESKTTGQTIDWSDLEISKKYHLEQQICFDEKTCFEKDTPFIVEDIYDGLGAPLVAYKLRPYTCAFPETQTEQILVEPEHSDHTRDRSAILQMDPNCDLTIWVETQDYYSTSFLSEP